MIDSISHFGLIIPLNISIFISSSKPDDNGRRKSCLKSPRLESQGKHKQAERHDHREKGQIRQSRENKDHRKNRAMQRHSL